MGRRGGVRRPSALERWRSRCSRAGRATNPGPLRLSVWLGMLVVVVAYWFAISLLLPHADAPWTRLLPGALLVALGMQVLHLATVLYFGRKISSSSELYGGLGAAAAILLWLYVFGRLVVASAVLNATLWQRHRERAERRTRPHVTFTRAG